MSDTVDKAFLAGVALVAYSQAGPLAAGVALISAALIVAVADVTL